MEERFAQQAQDTYRINQIQMASKEQLLIITYDIGIRACAAAEQAIESKNVEEINTQLQRAQSVVRELMITLDVDQGGEVANSLMRLYDYMYYQLIDANVKKDIAIIKIVRQMLEELKSTWIEAITKLKTEAVKRPATNPAQQGGANFAY